MSDQLYWVGVSVRFTCPACNRVSVETMALTTKVKDVELVKKSIRSQKLACQICKAPIPNGTQVAVHMTAETPERLRKMGYPVPPDK